MTSDTTIGLILFLFFLFACIACVCVLIIIHTPTQVNPDMTPVPMYIIPEDTPT